MINMAIMADIDFDHLAEVLSDFSTVKLFSPPPLSFTYWTFWKKVIMCSPHLKSRKPSHIWRGQSMHINYLDSFAWEICFFFFWLFTYSIIYIRMDSWYLFYTWGCNPELLYLVAQLFLLWPLNPVFSWLLGIRNQVIGESWAFYHF